MKRCPNCNTELTEQAHFCNKCGTSQTIVGPQQEISTSSKKETADKTQRCPQCEAELLMGVSFCNVCGTAQSSKASSTEVTTSAKQEILSSVVVDNKASSAPLPKSLTPTRSIHPGIKGASSSQEPVDKSIHPKKITLPPVVPSRPTKIEVKSAIVLPQRNSFQFALSPEHASSTAPISSSSPAIPEHTKQPDTSSIVNAPQISSALKVENISSEPTQSLEVLYQKTTIEPSSRQMSSLHDFDKLPTSHLSTEHFNGGNGLTDTPTVELVNPASILATSKAAEHWRKSWRDRQYVEAGPAENVSRGQALVPMPLMEKQQSFARMRAIARNNQLRQKKRATNFGTWTILFLMICLIAGLGGYIVWSYLPNSPFGLTRSAQPVNIAQPTLAIEGSTSTTVKVGQVILLHGEQFGANHTITFLLDMVTPLVDANGKNISSLTNSQGNFDATISINSHWTTGTHSIEAVDSSSNLNAFLTLQVTPAGTPETNSSDLSVTTDDKIVQMLTFKAVIGQAKPEPQRITITNKSRAPMNWTAAASASSNLSWLIIDDNNTFGQLAISQPHDILISVNIVGLKSTPKKPYTGQIVFTINNNQLLTVPVQLWISDATPEMVFSPNPIIAQRGPGNTCNPGVTLTLINLGTLAISWSVNPDANIKGNIKFISNGQILESGTLLPSGQPGDSVVLNLQCNAIQVGRQYHVSVYANQMSWSEFVIVQ